jgi:ABC-2 type transport system permease protein
MENLLAFPRASCPGDLALRSFFPIVSLPVLLLPLSYVLPLTYGVDILCGSTAGTNIIPLGINSLLLAGFCSILLYISIRNINRKWIT